MADYTMMTTEGEQPSSTNIDNTSVFANEGSDAGFLQDHYSTAADDAHTPSGSEYAEGVELNADRQQQGEPYEQKRWPGNHKPDASLDEIIASLPEDVMAGLDAREIEALAAGDPDTVARVLYQQPRQAGYLNEMQTLDNTTDAANINEEENQTTDTSGKARGIERISLRGLTVQDQHAIADAIAAVRRGEFASFEEAHAAMYGVDAESEAEAVQAYAADDTAWEDADITQLQQRITEIELEQKEAAASYDTQAMLELATEMMDVKLALRDALQSQQIEAQNTQVFHVHESASMQRVQQLYPQSLSHPEILAALEDARDLAEHRQDPILQRPDWPEHLVARVLSSFYQGDEPSSFPTPPPSTRKVRGALEAPAWQGVSNMSVNAALSELDNMTEDQIDAVLKGVQTRQRAEHLRR